MASSRRAIGLLAEKYSKWERRAALTPSHVQRLVKSGIDVLVQPSTSRVYADSEYSNAGAVLTSDLSDASAIFGVKQPVNGTLLPGKTYLVFSHVIKAQQENMALLDELLDKRCRLIDYECVREGGGGSTARLIAFGGELASANSLRLQPTQTPVLPHALQALRASQGLSTGCVGWGCACWARASRRPSYRSARPTPTSATTMRSAL